MKQRLLLFGATFLASVTAFGHFGGSVGFGGRIREKTAIEVEQTRRALALDLIQGGQVRVADTKEYSNSIWGYRVRLESENGFMLVHEDEDTGKDSRVPYDIKYKLSAPLVTLGFRIFPIAVGRPKIFRANHDALATSQEVIVSNQGLQFIGITRKGKFFVRTHPQVEKDLLAGVHSDTLTFTIEAKERPFRFRH